jgi:hypothetical protein
MVTGKPGMLTEVENPFRESVNEPRRAPLSEFSAIFGLA